MDEAALSVAESSSCWSWMTCCWGLGSWIGKHRLPTESYYSVGVDDLKEQQLEVCSRCHPPPHSFPPPHHHHLAPFLCQRLFSCRHSWSHPHRPLLPPVRQQAFERTCLFWQKPAFLLPDFFQLRSISCPLLCRCQLRSCCRCHCCCFFREYAANHVPIILGPDGRTLAFFLFF